MKNRVESAKNIWTIQIIFLSDVNRTTFLFEYHVKTTPIPKSTLSLHFDGVTLDYHYPFIVSNMYFGYVIILHKLNMKEVELH